MAQNEFDLESPLQTLRRRVIEKIQKGSRDARNQTQQEENLGATSEPMAPTPQATTGNPLKREDEYEETEA
jgi:hypothetical protein|tara:strand:+ start:2640 stop:2852 length:213 start_codon:yes stop_codon:yes gene_type:complete